MPLSFRAVRLSGPGGVTFILLKIVRAFVPLRVSQQQESQHGEALQ
jgi:ammonium transporter, Amt family